MGTGYPLRLYANPVKVLFYLALVAGFALVGYWLPSHHGLRWTWFDKVIAYGMMIGCGLGAVATLLAGVFWVVFRRPLLTIDGQGWSVTSSPFGGGQSKLAGHQRDRGVPTALLARPQGISTDRACEGS